MDVHAEQSETPLENSETTPEKAPALRSERALNRLVKRINSRAVTILAIVILLAVAGWYGRPAWMAASINGAPVSRAAVLHELETRSGRVALEALITRRLIDREAKRLNITVTDDEVAAEAKKIEDQLATQGLKLDEALAAQGMTRADLNSQLVIQKEVEKILGDRINVTDAEVDKYIADNQIKLEKGKEADMKAQLKEQLRGQKASDEAMKLEDELRAKADIKYYGSYVKPSDASAS